MCHHIFESHTHDYCNRFSSPAICLTAWHIVRVPRMTKILPYWTPPPSPRTHIEMIVDFQLQTSRLLVSHTQTHTHKMTSTSVWKATIINSYRAATAADTWHSGFGFTLVESCLWHFLASDDSSSFFFSRLGDQGARSIFDPHGDPLNIRSNGEFASREVWIAVFRD